MSAPEPYSKEAIAFRDAYMKARWERGMQMLHGKTQSHKNTRETLESESFRLRVRLAKADALADAAEGLEDRVEHGEYCTAPSRVFGATECPCGAIQACVRFEAALAAYRELSA